MEKFEKITEEMYYDDNYNLYDNLSQKVDIMIYGNCGDYRMMQEMALIDCESPIEQLLSLEMENLNLKFIREYNPYVDIVDIEKQVKIKCGKKSYRVDFLIPVIYKNRENKCFIIECDGYEFHQKTKEQVEKDNIRQRDLQKEGYEVIRFSGTEIWHRPYDCAREILNIILSYCNYKGE